MDKIICVGKNYLDHSRELGDAVPEKPVLFLKPPSSMVVISSDGMGEVRLPFGRGPVHPECEIVARISAQGAIDAVTLGLDMTLRDVQAGLKKAGHPWEISKVFAGSAVIGEWVPVFPEYLDEEFSLAIDGEIRQRGRGREMRMSPEGCVAYAGEHFPLRAGDALFTGTPAGVGPVEPGQTAELRWGSKLKYRVRFL
jgi:2-keto-4-pentenoate hydratase/2-oxohepta-3-ene-1,7-dioic acid hydratase in catechol pathway